MNQEVTLNTNGKKLAGWTSVTIRKSIEQFADEFDFELSTDRINDSGFIERTGVERSAVLSTADAVNQDDKIEIMIGKELVLTGYVDNIDIDYDANSASVRIGGLSKTGDLVDSSAIYKTGVWTDARVDDIVRDICGPFGIDVLTVGSLGENFKRFKLEPGEKCYEAISRAIGMRQLLATSQPDGTMSISSVRKAYAGARIELGVNVVRATANRNRRDVHNRYVFKGQTASSDDWNAESATQLEGVIEDPDVKRYRPLVILARKQKHKEDLGKRAIWERNVRAGRGERFRYTVDGWLDNVGRLWETNTLVRVKDEFSRVDGEMLASTIEFTLADRMLTMIEVVPPGTFDPLDASVKKKTKL